MSNAQQFHTEEHQSAIKTPKQLIIVIALSFIVPIAIIVLLVSLVTSGAQSGAGSRALSQEAIDARIAPVAQFELVDANAPRVFQTGEAVYKTVCAACHAAGVAGAPKFGDVGGWAAHIASGLEEMVRIAIHGKGAMPPKGGAANLSDLEVARAVVYMANNAGGNFAEPAEPAAEGAAEGADAAAAPAEAAAPAAAAPAAESAPAAAEPAAAPVAAPAAS